MEKYVVNPDFNKKNKFGSVRKIKGRMNEWINKKRRRKKGMIYYEKKWYY